MMKLLPIFIVCSSLLTPLVVVASASTSTTTKAETSKPVSAKPAKTELNHNPQYRYNHNLGDWGIAIGMRRGDIPFATEDDVVYDVLPLIRYQNDHLFINGMEGGIHFWKNDHHQINLYSRFRFVDIPQEFQNDLQAQAFDFGLQYRFIEDKWEADIALMSDTDKYSYAYTRVKYHWQWDDFDLTPFAELQWKSSDFNNRYYGLDKYEPNAGVAAKAGVKARYHLYSNLYLIGQVAVDRLEDDIKALPIIDSQYQYESFLGFGFFPEPNKHGNNKQYHGSQHSDDAEYFRLAHAWATPSNLSNIFSWNTATDPYNNQMSSLFYGTRLTKTLFSLPIELYFTPGVAWHYESEVQDKILEGVLAIKGYYTFTLGPRWRLGVAEGLSYVSQVTYIEGSELEEKELKPSKLLNYLDFSLDMNVGDLFNNHQLNQLWFGYSIHHRSGIFGQSSAFGRISGGSNYQSLYLQWHF